MGALIKDMVYIAHLKHPLLLVNTLGLRWLEFSYQGRNHFSHSFWSLYEHLFHYWSEVSLSLLNYSYNAPTNCVTLEYLTNFEHVIKSLWNTCLFFFFFSLFYSHLPTHHSNLDVWLKQATKLTYSSYLVTLLNLLVVQGAPYGLEDVV